MEGFVYNDRAINSNGSLASIVYLPTSEMSVGVLLYERNSILLSGSITTGADLVGDISKVANLGTGTVEWGLEVSSDLSQSKRIYFENSALTFGLENTGTIVSLTMLPEALATMENGLDGYLSTIKVLSGSSASTFEPTGLLSATKTLGEVQTTTSFDISGVVGATQYLAGILDTSTITTGSLTLLGRNYFDPASVTTSVAVTGDLRLTGGLFGQSSSTTNLEGSLSVGKRVELPQSSSSIGFETAGTLRLRGGLQGVAPVTFGMTGSLHIGYRVPFPASNTAQTIDMAASGISLRGGLSGNTVSSASMDGELTKGLRAGLPISSVSFDTELSGQLSSIIRFNGVSSMSLTPQGMLSNNVETQDEGLLLMIRRYRNREMVR